MARNQKIKTESEKIVWREARGQYVVRYKTASGQWRERATGVSRRSRQGFAEAVKAAEELSPVSGGGTDWLELLGRFVAEHLSEQSRSYRATMMSAVASFEAHSRPATLRDVTDASIAAWVRSLSAAGKSESTARTYVKHLRAMLAWGVANGVDMDVPSVPVPKPRRRMRGRPITARELARMMRAARTVRPRDSSQWVDLLKGLWWSGLRLSEAVALGWNWSHPMMVDFSDARPRFIAYAQKSGHEQVFPMSPEFAAFVSRRRASTGYVFVLPSRRVDTVGRVVADIGRAAGVQVSRGGKFASAHDLRRSFATRWARHLMPSELMVLMRHASITTTMTYYVDQDANDVTARLYDLR